MKNEFVLAFNEVLEDKQLPREIVLEALQAAMISAYRRTVNASNAQHVDALIDAESGKVLIYVEKEIVETVEDPRTEVSLREAERLDSSAKVGGMIVVESTPHNFGRVAAQTARQVIQQRIREAERDAQFTHYNKQTGEIISGVVQTMNVTGLTLGLDMRAEGILPRSQQVPGERFRLRDRVRALLLEVKQSPRGPQIVLSRAHRNFLRRLLENEVPEIYHGMVEIRSIAREPGQRSKVAVAALQAGVDPVGACVGVRGVRIQAIVRELNEEKIDVIEWSPDSAVYIAKALSPARVTGVFLNEQSKGAKTATVVVPEDQLSLAIGRDGQNARLAAKLTGWRIDIKSLPEAATDSLHKLQKDPAYAFLVKTEAEIVPQIEYILAKKAESRPVTPEEYQMLAQFVDRIERGIIRQRQSDKRLEEERQLIVQADIPADAYKIALQDFAVSDRVFAVISEAGFQTVGDLMLQMKLDPDSIQRLNGMGPKAMRELEEALQTLEARLRPVEAPLEVVAAPVPEAVLVPAESAPEAVVAAPEPLAEIVSQPVAETPVAVEAVVGKPEPAIELALPEPGVEVKAPEVLAAALAGSVEVAPLTEAEIEKKEEAVEVVGPAPAPEAEAVTEKDEKPRTLDELFSMTPEQLGLDELDEEEEETDRKHTKKKKKRFQEVEFDPEKNAMIVHKKRKRGEGEWTENW